MLRMGIWTQMFKDSSTSHMAEMMIQGAKELMDLEEKAIMKLRDYL